MADKCTITDCNKSASYGLFYMKGIYCRQHGIEMKARPKQKICICGSSAPTFGNKDDERPSCCAKCKTNTMADHWKNKCKECALRASFGKKGEKSEYCATHKKEGMVDLMNKLCEKCDKIATFGADPKKPTSCASHKTTEMTAKSHKMCETGGCKKTASYGHEWQKPIMCAAHAQKTMKNVVSKRCEFEGCEKQASFGTDGKKTHCKTHKSEVMESGHKKCESVGCITRASYGAKESAPSHCAAHKSDEMRNLTTTFCSHAGCEVMRPTFGTKDGKEFFCEKHKTVLMVDKRHKYCENCSSRANFGPKGGKPSHCSKHKKEGMIDLANRCCEHSECDRITPSFGFKSEKGRFCAAHKLDGMIDVRHKICEAPGCDTQATYVAAGETKPRRCAKHLLENMVVLHKKTCKHPGCETSPSFGIKDGKSEYCISHKLPGMIQLSRRPCAAEGCDVNASYSTKGDRPLYCAKHKEKGMINTYGKVCDHEGCSKSPSFGYKGGMAGRCAAHALSEMIDVKHTTCECGTRTHYGKPGTAATKCWKHRETGMIRRPGSKCKKCSDPAIYGANYINLHCEAHKETDEQNYVERACAGCGLTMILDSENKCEYCVPAKFQAGRLAKQNALMSHLDRKKLKGTSTDKIVEGGACGKERPDRIFDNGKFVVILECDEHQHKDRACVCEQTRMVNIGQTFGGTPVHFIRFNPDDYAPDDDSKIPEPIQKRHKLVADLISDILEERVSPPAAGLVNVLYLFYDGWSSLSAEEWKALVSLDDSRISHL